MAHLINLVHSRNCLLHFIRFNRWQVNDYLYSNATNSFVFIGLATSIAIVMRLSGLRSGWSEPLEGVQSTDAGNAPTFRATSTHSCIQVGKVRRIKG